MNDFAWLQWAIPAGVFVAGLIAHWGINETRVRGQQHQINALRKDLDRHLIAGEEVRQTLARLDERTLHQGQQLERIENKLNGK